MRRWAAVPGLLVALTLTLAACVTARVGLPAGPVAAGPTIAVQTTPVLLDPADPARTTVGDFAYAGGVAIVSDATSRLHGLSDLLVNSTGGMTAVSDDGDLFTGRLLLDPAGRLVGLTDAAMRSLTGPGDGPLQGKEWADAEGLTRLGDGAMLVSFERRHRVWLYESMQQRRPTAVALPAVSMAENDGMEGLTAAPALGPDTYWVGLEPGGIWLCRIKLSCDEVTGLPRPPPGYRLSSLATGPNGELVILHHSYIPTIGSRIIVTIVRDPTGAKRIAGGFAMTPPLTVDNFEGVAVVARRQGPWRLYLLSDDNFSPTQRTLLLAFDWIPPE